MLQMPARRLEFPQFSIVPICDIGTKTRTAANKRPQSSDIRLIMKLMVFTRSNIYLSPLMFTLNIHIPPLPELYCLSHTSEPTGP